MKREIPFIIALVAAACNNSGKLPARGDQSDSAVHKPKPYQPHEEAKAGKRDLIVAGERVGKISIGITSEDLIKTLGPPDESDAAMGKAWLSWKGKGFPETMLSVYTAYSDTSMRYKTVQFIRTDSPLFKTAEGIGAGSVGNELIKAYPQAKEVAKRTNNKASILLYDNGDGIAFEVAMLAAEKKCIAVFVYQKGRSLLDIYRTQQPKLTTFYASPTSHYQ